MLLQLRKHITPYIDIIFEGHREAQHFNSEDGHEHTQYHDLPVLLAVPPHAAAGAALHQ